MKKDLGYVAISEEQKSKSIRETFKGEVLDTELKVPKSLGISHPYDFKIVESLYRNVPFVKGAIDKHVDSIVSDFSVKSLDKNAQAFLNDFINRTNFRVFLRQWVLGGLVVGNGFAEVDLDNAQVRILDPKTMYVRRNNVGKVLGYNQFFGNAKVYLQNHNKVIPFEPNEIAHLKLNDLNGDAYGLGLIFPNLKILDNLVGGEMDMHTVLSRKADAPYHIKVGVPGQHTNPSVIADINSKLQYLNNSTEWATDANVEIKAIDFGNSGDKFINVLEYDQQQLIFGFQVPAVLMGVDNIPEGLATTQLEAWQRRIRSLQEAIEKIMEETIFRPLLIRNNLEGNAEVTWDLPGESEINERIAKISELLSNTKNLSENMRRMLEIELVNLFGIPDGERWLNKPDVELMKKDDKMSKMDPIDQTTKPANPNDRNPERKAESQIKQPEFPGVKRIATESEITESEMTVKDWINFKEIEGYEYSDYLANILLTLQAYDFPDLLAKSDLDIRLGLLKKTDIEKLRIVLKDGFQNNKTMQEIENDIKKFVPLTDRFHLKDGQKVLSITAKERPNGIARTETVRLANKGLLKTYQDNKIKEVQFLAALSDRTCPECLGLNGNVYNIIKAEGIIPVHTSCRCTWLSITG